jgi:23S rRNA C2498 (ribose-2'-O)-methylase RlmM
VGGISSRLGVIALPEAGGYVNFDCQSNQQDKGLLRPLPWWVNIIFAGREEYLESFAPPPGLADCPLSYFGL